MEQGHPRGMINESNEYHDWLETVHEVSKYIRLQCSGLETKMSDKRDGELKWKFGFSNAFVVKKSVGLSRGICLYWNNDSKVNLKSLIITLMG
jgi:hypothetical protein